MENILNLLLFKYSSFLFGTVIKILFISKNLFILASTYDWVWGVFIAVRGVLELVRGVVVLVVGVVSKGVS